MAAKKEEASTSRVLSILSTLSPKTEEEHRERMYASSLSLESQSWIRMKRFEGDIGFIRAQMLDNFVKALSIPVGVIPSLVRYYYRKSVYSTEIIQASLRLRSGYVWPFLLTTVIWVEVVPKLGMFLMNSFPRVLPRNAAADESCPALLELEQYMERRRQALPSLVWKSWSKLLFECKEYHHRVGFAPHIEDQMLSIRGDRACGLGKQLILDYKSALARENEEYMARQNLLRALHQQQKPSK